MSDGMLLGAIIPRLIKTYLSDHKHYIDILELFNHVNLATVFGQRLDSTYYTWSQMTIDRWKNIVYNKTVWHQSIFPFKTALYLTDTYEPDTFKTIEPLLVDFGLLVQITVRILITAKNHCYLRISITHSSHTYTIYFYQDFIF